MSTKDQVSDLSSSSKQMFTNNAVRSIYDFCQKKNLTILTKLVFNLAGLVRVCFVAAIAVVPFDVDTPTCKGIIYPSIIGNFFMQTSLGLFLLWRLRLIERKSYDLWIGGFLLIVRALTQVSNLYLELIFV